MKNKILFTLLLTLFSFSFSYAQYDIPEKPNFQTSVYDYYKLLTPSQKSSLEQKLIKYSDTTSTQIVVAIIASTKGEEIKYLGAQWGINGVLAVVRKTIMVYLFYLLETTDVLP
ncbi:beta-propeller domains of methanol dehydrogenase type [Jejuia pallidilutea]|uniref:Beta-propeller domains of methanol dehydrogenase type n=1 Tax=Jejuia pallidilutea TaxID=504487 RepID=A0A090W846_9FLAO|nr:beta-propeller domains of methanol dehydrogenase type [Jejuia pallidilutea]GAL73190.1 beta-propeller domains of methanol dehydrogenase type [Jejuia pallidilutea]